MLLVVLAALFVAVLFLLFKGFEALRVPLLPAIVINYIAAFGCGLVISRPWEAGDLSQLWAPCITLGVLFIAVFYLTGLSAQRSGIAVTTVASKMSLVLTVAFSVVAFNERQGPLGWTGILLALCGVLLSSWRGPARSTQGAWSLPVLLFLGNAAIDIGLTYTQRTRTSPLTEAVFPTLIFALAGMLGLCWSLVRHGVSPFRDVRTWLAGLLLGLVNYGSLYFVVKALSGSGLPGSSIFPLMNIGVILFGTLGGFLAFGERPGRAQLAGIGLAVIAMLLILSA